MKFQWDLGGSRAFHREYSGNHAPKPLGNHANFVINFCQILFEAETTRIAPREETTMRVSDDRYTRDRQRLDLGLRLIRHEARTFTIRQWTGLSDDRIRKLYRSYVMNHDARRFSGIAANRRARRLFLQECLKSIFSRRKLASLYVMYGLLIAARTRGSSRYRIGSLESGTLLCQAYEAYLELHSPAGFPSSTRGSCCCALARPRRGRCFRACELCGGVRLRDLLGRNTALVDRAVRPHIRHIRPPPPRHRSPYRCSRPRALGVGSVFNSSASPCGM
jgi:hypothetical protein